MLIPAIIFILSGCSLHSSMLPESRIDIPPSYSNADTTPSPSTGRWWEQFNDNELNRLVEQALAHNLDIAQSYERLQQSLALVRATNASGGPVLNIEGSAGRAQQPGTFGTITGDTYSLSAAASYEIDLFGKLKSRTEAARYDALASGQDLRSLYISISARLADLYYLAVEQNAQLELSEQTILSFEDTLARVNRRYRAGLVPAIDIYQSRQNLAAARAQKPLFESGLATTLNSIAVLTGKFPTGKLNISTSELTEAPVFSTGIPSEVLAARPDVQAAFLRLEAKDKRVAAAIADRFPSFNLVGTYGGASENVRSVLDSPNIFWNILLQASQPVFDAGRRKAEEDRAKSAFREQLASYHKTVLNAFKDVEDALVKDKSSEQRIRMLGETVSASENSLRLAIDRYMQGLTDYMPVLSDQVRHYTANSSLLAARRQLISDRIQLARALGGEWTDNEIRKNHGNSLTLNSGDKDSGVGGSGEPPQDINNGNQAR